MQDFDVIPFPGGKKKDLISTHCSVHVCLHWMQNAHTELNKCWEAEIKSVSRTVTVVTDAHLE